MSNFFYSKNIEEDTLNNNKFRKVISTNPGGMQLVLMSLKPKEDIGLETHHEIDQMIRVESGNGVATVDGKEYPLDDGSLIIVPKGSSHNITNTSKDKPLKLYTIYCPPEHPPNREQEDKPLDENSEDAENTEDLTSLSSETESDAVTTTEDKEIAQELPPEEEFVEEYEQEEEPAVTLEGGMPKFNNSKYFNAYLKYKKKYITIKNKNKNRTV